MSTTGSNTTKPTIMLIHGLWLTPRRLTTSDTSSFGEGSITVSFVHQALQE